MTRSTDDVIKGRSRIRVPPLLSLRSASSLNKTRVVALRFHTASASCLVEATRETVTFSPVIASTDLLRLNSTYGTYTLT